MAVELRFPNITGGTEREQLSQVKSYLHQLVEQLQWALQNVDAAPNSNVVVASTTQTPTSAQSSKNPQVLFGELKPLIIKSAEIVSAYYEEISNRLVGEYSALSDFGIFTERTEQQIKETSESIERIFTNVQEIETDISNVDVTLAKVNATIKMGELDYDEKGSPIYGIEVGQANEVEGEKVFNKYARFTSNRISFYDQNDIEVAYISDFKLYITQAEITGSITLGGYLIDTTNGLTFRWAGGSKDG